MISVKLSQMRAIESVMLINDIKVFDSDGLEYVTECPENETDSGYIVSDIWESMTQKSVDCYIDDVEQSLTAMGYSETSSGNWKQVR
jgi:hypothetical protein